MSIAIVSALPKSTPTAQTESSAPEGEGALDFASLLFGQSIPLVADINDKIQLSPGKGEKTDGADDLAGFVVPFLSLTQESISLANSSVQQAGEGEGITQGNSLLLNLSPEQKIAGELDTSGEKSVMSERGLGISETSQGKSDTTAKFAVNLAAADTVDDQLTTKEGKSSLDSIGQNHLMASLSQDQKTQHVVGRDAANLSVSVPVRDAAWNNEFGQKIIWMAHNSKQSAQIVLNPPQMGPVEVSLNIDKGTATAVFVSANAEVRESIESAMPRLREMFASAGIELGQTNVSSESFQQQQHAQAERHANSASSSSRTDDGAILEDGNVLTESKAQIVRQGNGMVDIFA